MDKRKQKTLFTKMNIKIIINDELTELEINRKKDRKHQKFSSNGCGVFKNREDNNNNTYTEND